MRRFDEVVQSEVAPNINSLWINNGEYLYYNNGEWVPLAPTEEEMTYITSSINAHNTAIKNMGGSITVLNSANTNLSGKVLSSVGIPKVKVNLSLLTESYTTFKQGTEVNPAPESTSGNRGDAAGNAIYYKRVPFIIIYDGTLGTDSEVGIPCVLKAPALYTKKHAEEDAPTYESVSKVTLGDESTGTKVTGKITVVFDSIKTVKTAKTNWIDVTFTKS